MKKIIQLVSLAAAAGVIVGCSSENGRSSSYNGNNPSAASDTSTASASGQNMNYANGGTITSSSGNTMATGNEGTGYQLNNPADQAAANVNHAEAEGHFSHTKLTIDQLPQAAQTTIRGQIGDQQVTSITEETKDGQTCYKVELPRKSWFSLRPQLTVGADGSLVAESHMKNIYEAAGADNSGTNSVGSQANPSGQVPAVTNGPSGVEEQRNDFQQK